jgi:hypothetical protein
MYYEDKIERYVASYGKIWSDYRHRFLANPTAAHLQAAHRALRYLGHTKSLGGATYYGRKKGFKGVSDSDWGADTDTRS